MDHAAAASAFVGIDVAKDRLDVHVRPSGNAFAVPRDGAGLDRLIADLHRLAPILVVLEATDGFERMVVAALAGAELPLAVVNPHQIRDFAWATGRPAKTDRLDAEIIAIFAERIRPEDRPVASNLRRWSVLPRSTSIPARSAASEPPPWGEVPSAASSSWPC